MNQQELKIEYVPIRAIEVEDYVGDVFNLQTENEEFIAEGIVSHNCPHLWDITTPKLSPEDCAGLWKPGGPPFRMPGVPTVAEPVVVEPELPVSQEIQPGKAPTGPTDTGKVNDFLTSGHEGENLYNFQGGKMVQDEAATELAERTGCLLYTSPSPRDATLARMPSSA